MASHAEGPGLRLTPDLGLGIRPPKESGFLRHPQGGLRPFLHRGDPGPWEGDEVPAGGNDLDVLGLESEDSLGPSHQPVKAQVTVTAGRKKHTTERQSACAFDHYQFLFKNMLKTWCSIKPGPG